MSLWQVLRQEAKGAVRSLRYDLGNRGEGKADLTVRPEHFDPDGFDAAADAADRPRRRLYVAGLGVLLAGAGVGAYVGAVQGLSAMMPLPRIEPPATSSGAAAPAVVTVPRTPEPAAVEIVSTVEPEIRIKWRTKYVTVAPPPLRPGPGRTAPVLLPTPKPNCNCVDPPTPVPTEGTPPQTTPTGQPEGSPTGTPASPTPAPTPEGTANPSGQN